MQGLFGQNRMLAAKILGIKVILLVVIALLLLLLFTYLKY